MKATQKSRSKGAAPSGENIAAGERVAKVIARAGLCSRREAEKLIEQGRVEVDGKTLETPATIVTSDNSIRVDGEVLPAAEPPRMWRYHKPSGQITTRHDPEGRPTVFDDLPPDLPRVLTIGRLDLTTEGLLLFTNDGELKRRLELPSTGWVRRYRVRVFGPVTQARLDGLAEGLTVEGLRYGPIIAKLERQLKSNSWLSIAIKEGKNREIRKICEHLGLSVSRLIRLSYGPFQLGALKKGEIEEVSAKVLREQLGIGDTPAKQAKKGFADAKPRKGKSRRNKSRESEPRESEPRESWPTGKKSAGLKPGDGRKRTASVEPSQKSQIGKKHAHRGRKKQGQEPHNTRGSKHSPNRRSHSRKSF
ncbi:MAG: pseudouridine synthase [Pseudomonadota bacterium]